MGCCLEIEPDPCTEQREPPRYTQNPSAQNSQRQQQRPYAQNPYAQSRTPAYAQNPYAKNPYAQSPYAQSLQNPYQGKSRSQPNSAPSQQPLLQCANCHAKLGIPPGAHAVTCPQCGFANGVPFQPTGYQQHLGLTPAPVLNQPPPAPTGRKRALLVGCNYPGTQAELRGCVNDVRKVRELLVRLYGFEAIRVLTDDGRSRDGLPTRANVEQGLRWLTEGAMPGDVLFFHFSGHGGQEEDPTYTEEDGYDETLCPTDFQVAGQIVDSAIFDLLCAPLPSGVKVTAVLDCCHSGTGLDLAFTQAGGRWAEEENPCHCAADVQLISGCEDAQCSADASDRYGTPAGALTTALCEALEGGGPAQPYPQLLQRVHAHLQQHGHSQRPQLTSSQAFDLGVKPFNPCGDIVSNMNPLLGRHFRKHKHPRRDFAGAFGNMLDIGSSAMLMGAVLPSVLDLGVYGLGAGVLGGGLMDMGSGFADMGGGFSDVGGGLVDMDGGTMGGGEFFGGGGGEDGGFLGMLGGLFAGGDE